MAINVSRTSSFRQASVVEETLSMQPSGTSLSSFTSSGSLEEILSMSNEEIFRKGIPLDALKVWRDRFYQSLDDEQDGSLLKLSRDDAWAYDRRFFKTDDKQMEIGFDENGMLFSRQLTHKDYFLSQFHHMMHPAFWEDRNRHAQVLLSLYRVHKIIAFSDHSLVDQVFLKLMDCVAEKIVAHHPKPKKDKIFTFALPDAAHHEVAKHKRLCCYMTEKGWRVGDFNAFPDTDIRIVQFNTNHTKKLILDQTDQAFNRPCTVIEARIRPEAEGALTKIVKVDIVLCIGPGELSHDRKNAVTFTFDIDLRVSPLQMGRFRQNSPWITDLSESVNRTEFERIQHEAELMFEVFQTKLTQPFLKSPDSHVAFELAPPQSSSDKLWVLACLLTELKSNSVVYAKEIAYIAEKMDCTFSEEELATLCVQDKAELTYEGYTVSPEAVADKLLTSVKTQFAQALKPPLPHASSSSSSFAASSSSPAAIETVSHSQKMPNSEIVIPEDSSEPVMAAIDVAPDHDSFSVEHKEEAERLQRLMEKQVEKERRREAYEYRQRKLEAEAEARKANEATNSTSVSLFSLDFEDQQQVDSIYKGYPMKAKDFSTFAMNLLQKKAQSLSATLHSNTVGSHPKLHFKRSDGSSGGVTFRIHHGGDDHGYVAAQKDTLNRIFRL